MSPASRSPLAQPVPRSTLALILAAFLATAALNLHHLAAWALPVALLVSLWHWHRLGTRSASGRWLRYGAMPILVLGVLASFRTLNGAAAGATLLTVMGALKLLEARRARDYAFLIGGALFLLLAACIDAQALWRLPLYAVTLWLCCAAILALARGPAAVSPRPSLQQSGRILLLAVPLALLLFVFFPRLPGSFWAVPRGDEAVTGLGNEMDPGSIVDLVRIDDPAMRVRFEGAMPPRTDLYWRGPVMHDFDGRIWRTRPGFYARRSALEFAGPTYRYSVALEPGPLEILPALELPEGELPPLAMLTADRQIMMPRPPSRTLNYTLTSRTRHRDTSALSELLRRADLALPRGRNPRTLELAQTLRAAAADERAYIEAVLERFRKEGFLYTLTPERLGAEPIDEFLFDTRAGFCGHYASAFVVLMRAAGIPARVVTGYQGGEWNPVGGYYLVRQSHAHAWAEVWLEGMGWQRVDPTAVVAPARLEGAPIDLIRGAERGGVRQLRRLPWIEPLFQRWDALNTWWNTEIVGYNASRQQDLFDSLGFGERQWRALAFVLLAGAGAWALLLLFVGWRGRHAAGPDALGRAWLAFGAKLARMGLARDPGEGPLDYAERIATVRPALAGRVRAIAREYAALRFGGEPGPAAVAAFRRTVRHFDPRQS
jgi:transglutaminase-like putative cysteine protease